MPKISKLKPCPFCGGEVDHYHTEHITFHDQKHRFRCKKCGVLIFFYTKNTYRNATQTKKDAVRIFNTRAKESETE